MIIRFLTALICLLNCFFCFGELTPQHSPPSVIVLFGATGDLAAKKLLPALCRLAQEKHLSENTVLVGFARKELTSSEFRDLVATAGADLEKFKERVFYQQGDFTDAERYQTLHTFLAELDEKFGTQGNRIYYLATHPHDFPKIIDHLKNSHLIYGPNESKWSRVVLEKPFGTDLKSALQLQELISKNLHETQVFRVDHYLAKEGVQNLVAFRFQNPFFEPLWNKKYIDHVQITLSEEIGIESRGRFWEETGALRDLFQNHLMQLLTLVAMEPPASLDAASFHQEKMRLLKAIRPFSSEDLKNAIVHGQYGAGIICGKEVAGYIEEESVSKSSKVETFIAAKLFIDNERWEGVPFYIRGGKRLAKQGTEIAITFKGLPARDPNVLLIRIQPKAGIFFRTLTKVPGLVQNTIEPVVFGYTSEKYFGVSAPDAYEKLLYDVLQGNKTFFVQAEEQILAWQLLSPVLQEWQTQSSDSIPIYPAGSWGPQIADKLLQELGHQWLQIDYKNL